MAPPPRERGKIQPKIELPDIASDLLSVAGPVSQAEIDRRLERAAGLVESFAEAIARPALEVCFAAAAGQGSRETAPLSTLAEEISRQTMLLDEVERFLGHIDGCRKA